MSSPVDQSRYQVRFEWGADGLARLAASDIVVIVDVLGETPDAGVDAAVGDTAPATNLARAAEVARAAPADVDATAGATADATTPADAGAGAPADATTPADAGADAAADAAATAAAAATADAVAAGVDGPLIVHGAVTNASAVAAVVLAHQHDRGARTSIAIIACGAEDSQTGALRFAVEDLLGAGAVIDALGALGIDHTSPEAAAACEAFRGLRGAVRHLLTASGSGQSLLAAAAAAASAAASAREADTRGAILAAATVDASASVFAWRDGAFARYA